MIDGVKIECYNVVDKWLACDVLDFYSKINTRTGEIIENTRIAKYRGLSFVIKRKSDGLGWFCYVRGSLHKYHNKGKHNADNFTLEQLQNTIQDIAKKFHIDPYTSHLRGVEFGVNIDIPVTVKQFLQGLVSYRGRIFETYKDGRKRLGNCVTFQQYSVKIYDKGREYNISKTLMRVEIAVNKMAYLKKYNIVTLSDLGDIDKLQPLGDLLGAIGTDWVYYEKGAYKWREMSDFQQKKVLYYARPYNWEHFNRNQRYKHFQRMQKLNNQFCTSSTPENVRTAICKKWALLSAEKGRRFNQLSETTNNTKKGDVLTVRINGYSVSENSQKTTLSKTQKNRAKTTSIVACILPHKTTSSKPRFCKCCKSNIDTKKLGAVFCSKKCNNKMNGKKRRQREKLQRQSEQKNIIKILDWLNVGLCMWWIIETENETVTLNPTEIQADKETISTITKIIIQPNDKRYSQIVLNDSRARKLIRELMKI